MMEEVIKIVAGKMARKMARQIERDKMKMKKINLKVQKHNLGVVMADEVVDTMVNIAKDNGWVCSYDDVIDRLWDHATWTSGDAEWTLVAADVFIKTVFDVLNDTCETRGSEFELKFLFKLVAVEG